MSLLYISILQYDIAWENKEANFATIERLFSVSDQHHDVVVLPEMFSTGFSMQSNLLAEENAGETITWIKSLARKHNAAICGSFIAKEKGDYLNRGFFITPDSEYYYDKRHLFRMGSETKHFSAGSSRLIVPFRGFNICLQVCYDLRFPVWSRNVGNEYDLLIYVANWPQPRAKVWNSLLVARAIENLSYVCGVNRIGTDGTKLHYVGDSSIIDYKGDVVVHLPDQEKILTAQLSKEALQTFREKFPAWKDADRFELL
ncbi:MAG: putative amidohydrolase [Bacteroidetes bacterium]|jgi:omega-amidase|nr:putative amidohydrolase [Bacteroidota bacterium]